ncbi:MAG: hypothetical protein EHM20_11670, partial [Alphaproteobacteria bacterium]
MSPNRTPDTGIIWAPYLEDNNVIVTLVPPVVRSNPGTILWTIGPDGAESSEFSLIWPSLIKVNGTEMPPKRTCAVPVKPDPYIVIGIEKPVGPLFGDKLPIEGAAAADTVAAPTKSK